MQAQALAHWADRLRDISATGLEFAKSVHDEIAFGQVQDVAMEMMAAAVGESCEQMEPLRASAFSHLGPWVGCDAAIVDAEGRMLLIRRADNGLWAMPGGLAEVGDTPAECAVREALEETGWLCRPVFLAAVHDSRLDGTISRHHMYQFLFVCEPIERVTKTPSHAIETLGQAWYAQEELPPGLDPGHATRLPVAFEAWRQREPAYFDVANPRSLCSGQESSP